MTGGYFGMICDIQETAWRDDDLMSQDTLFELQEKIADLAMLIANNENRMDDLVNAFHWLYRRCE